VAIKAYLIRDNASFENVNVFVGGHRRRRSKRRRRGRHPRRNKINATNILLLMTDPMSLGAVKEGKLILLPLLEGFVDPDH
jgi:hypothetical protein